MCNIKLYKKFVYIFTFIFSFFSFINYSFWLDLWVWFPPMRNIDEINQSIANINNVWTKDIRISELWNLREAQKDVYNWDALDARINSFYNNGTKILLMIEATWPDWLNSTWSHTEAATLTEFREYVNLLLTRYGDKLEWIGYWNEWNWIIDEDFQWNVDAYVSYANIIYDEVKKLPTSTRPWVVLWPYSWLPYVAYDQWLISDYKMEWQDVLVNLVSAYKQLPYEERASRLVEEVLSKAKYDVLNIHLYDTYYQWKEYVQAFQNINFQIKWKKFPIVVTEFWWPYPQHLYNILWIPSQELIATRLMSQVSTIAQIDDIKVAYLFKLTAGKRDIAHPDSYLFGSNNIPTYSFFVYKALINFINSFK